ncbi:glycoside hydrolase family 71/99-like protein [Ochrovirga pacifica]|uniref:glycoside hydrolase family 71/99-like protein n=1 Tax=Ochrovirga pacifica TaxID=1042376 RepID=UPI000255A550|nr:glycoside hydrolase family 71/99-like protein [Ochrovirga pacifica]
MKCRIRFLHKILLVPFLGAILSCSTSSSQKIEVNIEDNINSDENGQNEVTSVKGKILSGYQGWFNTPTDGYNLGWKHYKISGKFEPGICSIDYWPDLTEFTDKELFETSFIHSNGRKANVFSSTHPKTVDRHFKWMEEYGIDGVFVQRFVTNVRNQTTHNNINAVFNNCYQSSLDHNRLISVMYDFSGSNQDIVENTIKDWKQLVDKYNINQSSKKNLLTYNNKPIVALWGVGFKDREYTLENVRELIRFFKDDPVYGGCSILLGVPTGWRTLTRDCINDPVLHELIKSIDIVHPWTPGRYNSLNKANEHRQNYTKNDKAWCDANDLLYMPVVFPGFSWHNLKKGLGEEADLGSIPRLKGEFLWRQFYNGISENVETMYVAMFDEMDEGTCIFKVTDDVPIGDSPFLDYEGLPSDYYLWLTGKAGEMLRKEIPLTINQPQYPNLNSF